MISIRLAKNLLRCYRSCSLQNAKNSRVLKYGAQKPLQASFFACIISHSADKDKKLSIFFPFLKKGLFLP